MDTTVKFPENLQEAIKYFSEGDNALNFIVMLRSVDGDKCPDCGGKRMEFITTRKTWQCYASKRRFTVKTGSIMRDSPLTLETWMVATGLISAAKNGISSYEVSRALEVCQKTAWFLLHRIILMMQTNSCEKTAGTIEAEETFIGGRGINKHNGKKMNVGGGGKQVVMGLLE